MRDPQNIVIIGGGIGGLSLGAALSPSAYVTILEAETALAYHASGRSAALYEKNYGLASTVALSTASADFYLNQSDYLSPRGFMLIAKAAHEAAFHQSAAEMKLTPIPMDEARERVPILNDDIALAAYHDEAWDIDTDRLIQDCARNIRGNGGQVITDAKVTAISQDGTWHVTTTQGTHQGDMLINAAGAWADQIATMAGLNPIGITPKRRSMARIKTPDGMDIRRWPMVFACGEPWYAKPDAGALIVSPEDADPMPPQDAWPDDLVLAQGLDRFASHVTMPLTRPLTTWAGLRSFSPDGNLVIGPDPTCPNFVWHAGLGGYGFQTAPAAAQLGADLILGRPSPLPMDLITSLSPQRYRS